MLQLGAEGADQFRRVGDRFGKVPRSYWDSRGRPTSPGKNRAIGLVPDAATLGPRALRECDQEHTNL